MRVAAITIETYTVGSRLDTLARPATHENVDVWMPRGWYAHLMLAGTAAELDRLEAAAKRNSGLDSLWSNRPDALWVNMYTPVVTRFVKKGALTDAKVAAQLAKELEEILQSIISR